MTRGRLWWAGALFVAALASGLSSAARRPGTRLANVGWGGFGNTPDENRHSPLTQITRTTSAQLGRVFTVDFHAIDPTVRRGEQSYPGRVERHALRHDERRQRLRARRDHRQGQVALDARQRRRLQELRHRRQPRRRLCDGKLFLLTLDMTIVSLDPATGKLQRRVPIAQAVPGASSNYGYSETSAPICANHRLIVGAAGSEYGVRGFVMAYHTDLTPAWANPFWTIPPAGTEWRQHGTLVGGGVVWTPTTVDPTTNTLYFGTGSATPLYYPSLRPGSNPRADSLVAVDLTTGQMKWWQQQMAFNEWSYDTSQPPLVYTGQGRRQDASASSRSRRWRASGSPTTRRPARRSTSGSR